MGNRDRIILDGMGGDHAPAAIAEGAALASQIVENTICIVGDEKRLTDELARHKHNPKRIELVHAEEVISGDEAPVRAVRTKQRSSIVVGLNMLKNGAGGVFISAGNTGALMAGGLFILGRIQGIDRPAIASTYPILGEGVSLLVDTGANAECKPNNLLEFALMGSIYMEKVLNKRNPTVGLVNMGTEENKGTTVLKAAHALLAENRDTEGGLRFVGNIEARDIPRGAADVIVCDGYVGNVVLKLTEGLAWSIFQLIKQKFTSGLFTKVGALLLSGKLSELRGAFDYSEYGGAPILGIKGAVVKMHGSSNAKAVKNTIIKALPYMKNEVVRNIENAILNLEVTGRLE
ncbi:MAG: phosphate acyltransferase PlsX [Clostridiales Family XIII bacterium]|jgi:glycerol-3-phosphate acyltransferase PlsX|nr:phosphate acyltransferase PlsX [Clostridiales Family XIII bacterium]